MSSETAPTLLTIPCELRNAIYHYIFTPDPAVKAVFTHSLDPLATQLQVFRPIERRRRQSQNELQILRTCRQIHDEAHQLALSVTGFDVTGENVVVVFTRCCVSSADDHGWYFGEVVGEFELLCFSVSPDDSPVMLRAGLEFGLDRWIVFCFSPDD